MVVCVLITTVYSERTDDFYDKFIANYKTDIEEINDNRPMPLHPINDALLNENIPRSQSVIEIVQIEPKGDESSVGISSSNSSSSVYLPRPETKVVTYRKEPLKKKINYHNEPIKDRSISPAKVRRNKEVFNYNHSFKESYNTSGRNASCNVPCKVLVKKPKSGIILPKRVETYEDVIRRLKDVSKTRK